MDTIICWVLMWNTFIIINHDTAVGDPIMYRIIFFFSLFSALTVLIKRFNSSVNDVKSQDIRHRDGYPVVGKKKISIHVAVTCGWLID